MVYVKINGVRNAHGIMVSGLLCLFLRVMGGTRRRLSLFLIHS